MTGHLTGHLSVMVAVDRPPKAAAMVKTNTEKMSQPALGPRSRSVPPQDKKKLRVIANEK